MKIALETPVSYTHLSTCSDLFSSSAVVFFFSLGVNVEISFSVHPKGLWLYTS